MKKILTCILALLVTVSANSASWVKISTNKNGETSYIDLESLKVVNKDNQVANGFFKVVKALSKSDNSKYASTMSFHLTLYCKSDEFQLLSSISYNLRGEVIDNYQAPIYGSPRIMAAYPDTIGSDMLMAGCYTTGFKDL